MARFKKTGPAAGTLAWETLTGLDEQSIQGLLRDFTRIPCRNGHPAWIDALEKMAGKFLKAR